MDVFFTLKSYLKIRNTNNSQKTMNVSAKLKKSRYLTSQIAWFFLAINEESCEHCACVWIPIRSRHATALGENSLVFLKLVEEWMRLFWECGRGDHHRLLLNSRENERIKSAWRFTFHICKKNSTFAWCKLKILDYGQLNLA